MRNTGFVCAALRLCCCVLATQITTGCATVSINELAGKDDSERDTAYRDGGGGLRFYRGEPFIVVARDGEAYSANVIYLPDRTKEFVAKVRTGLGSASLTAKLDGGLLLTEIGAVSDSKSAELLTAVAAVMAAKGTTPQDNKAAAPLEISLYRISYKNNRVSGIERLSVPGSGTGTRQ